MLVSQGWLVASNLFTAREAKAALRAAWDGHGGRRRFRGEFTNRTAVLVGTNNLLLASAAMVILAYIAFRLAAAQEGAALSGARASETEEEFSLGGLLRDVGRSPHLRVIVGIMTVTYLVDVMVEFQFQYMAKEAYHGDHLTAFFGSFYGLWLNMTELVFQFFLTTAVIGRFGVGADFADPARFHPALVARVAVRAGRYFHRRRAADRGVHPLYPESHGH